MKELIDKTTAIFVDKFTYQPKYIIQAPGRVNLIGEHTDYNEGFVLPCAIDCQTVVSCSPREDNIIRVIAADYENQQDIFAIDKPIKPHPTYRWSNYIRGVIKYLQLKLPNSTFFGVDLVVSGNIPQGSGLSSSASLEVAIAKMMQTLYSLPLDETQLALISQEAENKFVGCNCGIMDQLISTLGKKQHAQLIDCRSLKTQAISLPNEMAIVIINSNIKRGLVDSEYNTRRKQCEAAAQFLGVHSLRDATLTQLHSARQRMDPVVYKRAHHVIAENGYTQSAAKALAESDLVTMGELMAKSHKSMRDDFEITVPAIDYLVDIIKHEIGDQGGVRMTGGGFGGCVVALVNENKIDAVKRVVSEKYQTKTGLSESIYVCYASDGASQVSWL